MLMTILNFQTSMAVVVPDPPIKMAHHNEESQSKQISDAPPISKLSETNKTQEEGSRADSRRLLTRRSSKTRRSGRTMKTANWPSQPFCSTHTESDCNKLYGYAAAACWALPDYMTKKIICDVGSTADFMDDFHGTCNGIPKMVGSKGTPSPDNAPMGRMCTCSDGGQGCVSSNLVCDNTECGSSYYDEEDSDFEDSEDYEAKQMLSCRCPEDSDVEPETVKARCWWQWVGSKGSTPQGGYQSTCMCMGDGETECAHGEWQGCAADDADCEPWWHAW